MASTQPRGLPGGATWAGDYQTPEEVAKKMFAERDLINAKTKLTWNPEAQSLYPTDRMVGEVNLARPYIRMGTRSAGRYYYIQNASIFLTNGKKSSMEEVREIEKNDPQLIKDIYTALDTFLADAAKRDDALCKICVKYRARNHEDYLRHILEAHPDHAMSVAGVSGVSTPPAPPAASSLHAEGTPAPSPAVPSALFCCNQTFKDERGLSAHKRFSKTHRGA